MTINLPKSTTLTGVGYATLRYEGVPSAAVRDRMGLAEAEIARLERMFLNAAQDSDDPMRPAFADHGRHVRAVMIEGGFPVLPERRR